MVESCTLVPRIKRRQGMRMEEKDSILFQNIKKAVKDYETAWNMWAYTKTTEFKERFGDKVEYDDFGEVTFDSYLKATGLKRAYDQQKDLEDVARDHKVLNVTFSTPQEALEKAVEINQQEKDFVGIVEEGKKVAVVPKNGRTLDKAKQQLYKHNLTKEIISLLHSLGFDVGFVNNPHFDGIYDPENASFHDGLMEVIRISKGEKGEEALPDDAFHHFTRGGEGVCGTEPRRCRRYRQRP